MLNFLCEVAPDLFKYLSSNQIRLESYLYDSDKKRYYLSFETTLDICQSYLEGMFELGIEPFVEDYDVDCYQEEDIINNNGGSIIYSISHTTSVPIKGNDVPLNYIQALITSLTAKSKIYYKP